MVVEFFIQHLANETRPNSSKLVKNTCKIAWNHLFISELSLQLLYINDFNSVPLTIIGNFCPKPFGQIFLHAMMDRNLYWLLCVIPIPICKCDLWNIFCKELHPVGCSQIFATLITIEFCFMSSCNTFLWSNVQCEIFATLITFVFFKILYEHFPYAL